jgi:hypothetical protein
VATRGLHEGGATGGNSTRPRVGGTEHGLGQEGEAEGDPARSVQPCRGPAAAAPRVRAAVLVRSLLD